jgi:hypothetical protein
VVELSIGAINELIAVLSRLLFFGEIDLKFVFGFSMELKSNMMRGGGVLVSLDFAGFFIF